MGNFKAALLGMSNSYDHLDDGSVVPVDKSELPIELPEDIDLSSQGNLSKNIQVGKILSNYLLGKRLLGKLIL